jgi:glycosyltransferase involved in cell wall biosynthesis
MRELERRQPTGRVALFAPCKGLDLDFEANIRALFRQDYDNYEIIFIVENTDDPAYPAIRRAISEHCWVPAHVIVAGRATDSGQKVHNLRVATEHISPRVKYLAFVDSDARPRPEWLRTLVSHLDQPELGAVTGYRWFTPARPTVANALVYSMNCDVMSLLTRSSHYLIWGGSWAIRREVFDSLHLRNAWKGTLSDDLVASRLMRQSRLGVRFEPGCVVASPLDMSLGQAMSFIRRQYLVARLYTFDWWLFSLIAATFSNVTWLGNLGVLTWSLLTGSPSPWIPISVSAVLYLVTVYRGSVRQDLVKTYFPHWEKASRRIRGFDVWANPLVEFAHGIGVTSAALGRYINWRGIRYRVIPGGQVQEIIRDGNVASIPRQEQALYRKAG